MTDLSPRDIAIQSALPVLIAPTVGLLPPLAPGHIRHVVSAAGLMVEAATKAMTARFNIAPLTGRALPYGKLTEGVDLPGGPVPAELLMRCQELARAALPNEWAGLIVLTPDGYQLVAPDASTATPVRVSYSAAGIDPDTVAIDIHSHGHLPAFFSSEDDADDLSQPTSAFISAVMGNLGTDKPSFVSRAVVHGRFFPLSVALPETFTDQSQALA